jgi:hypothetical protein
MLAKPAARSWSDKSSWVSYTRAPIRGMNCCARLGMCGRGRYPSASVPCGAGASRSADTLGSTSSLTNRTIRRPDRRPRANERLWNPSAGAPLVTADFCLALPASISRAAAAALRLRGKLASSGRALSPLACQPGARAHWRPSAIPRRHGACSQRASRGSEARCPQAPQSRRGSTLHSDGCFRQGAASARTGAFVSWAPRRLQSTPGPSGGPRLASTRGRRPATRRAR